MRRSRHFLSREKHLTACIALERHAPPSIAILELVKGRSRTACVRGLDKVNSAIGSCTLEQLDDSRALWSTQATQSGGGDDHRVELGLGGPSQPGRSERMHPLPPPR